MSDADEATFYIANALMRQAMMAIAEIMGERGLHIVLRNAGLGHYVHRLPPDNTEPAISFEDYARLNAAIEEFYGRAGKGMLRRIGRASFYYGLREQPKVLGLLGRAVKLLPERQRIKTVLTQMGKALASISTPETTFWIEEDDDTVAYCFRPCALCQGRQADHPLGHLLVGSIQTAVQWATGKSYPVTETRCMALGHDHGRVEVHLRP